MTDRRVPKRPGHYLVPEIRDLRFADVADVRENIVNLTRTWGGQGSYCYRSERLENVWGETNLD